jgi:hypothetical protein
MSPSLVLLCIMLTLLRCSAGQQILQPDSGLPGDNLNLYAVLGSSESPTLEEFDETQFGNLNINNLDLDGDGMSISSVEDNRRHFAFHRAESGD